MLDPGGRRRSLAQGGLRRATGVDRREEVGPFDVIGGVHGCFQELVALLSDLGYRVEGASAAPAVTHRSGRRLVFAGDVADRGPAGARVIDLVMEAVADGTAFCARGTHDAQLAGALESDLPTDPVGGFWDRPAEYRRRVASFIERLPPELVLDDGRLIVGGQVDPGIGSTISAAGIVVVSPGAADGGPLWRGASVYIDTGCLFGGRLTALRFPELSTLSVPARRAYISPSLRI